MAAYIRRGGLDVSPPPWRCDDIHATIFYVDADMAKLQALCDRTLNQPSGGRLKYQPVVSWIALTFQSFAGMRSLAPPDPTCSFRETHSYLEAAFWVMVENGNGLEVMIPYMFIDDAICVATGREVYGFPKDHAVITAPPRGDPQQERFAVEALAVDAGGLEARPLQILECVRRGSALVYSPAATPEVPLHEIDAIKAMWEIYQALISKSLSFAFLRQFRALGGGTGADLQQVVSAQAIPFDIHLGSIRILTDYELRLPQLRSHPIADDFGFPSGPLHVPFGFQCALAFTLQAGKVL